MPTATRPKRSSGKRSSTPTRRPPTDPVARYAEHVVAGKIVAGRLVRLACERHLRDIETGHERGLTWDRAAADYVIRFFRDALRLNGGDFEGKPFVLEPWQVFIVGSLFGWKREDGYRRFRTAYLEIGKGNGKSPLAAGTGILMLTADGEARAEVYAAAAKKDQAQILFRDAVAMVDQSPALTKRIDKSGGKPVWNLAYLKTSSFFRPIASDDAQSGPRPHCALLDEIHEHDSANVVDLMRAGTKGRRQPLMFEITNSGWDRQSVCWRHHEYSRQILEGSLPDDEWFAYVCGLDEKDDWRDEKVWVKANPNLGVSITHDYLRRQVREAEGMPAQQSVVKRLNFCEWTEQSERWIESEVWDKNGEPVDETALIGRECYAGLDLSTTTDISGLVLVFPLDDGTFALLPRFWVPKANAKRMAQRSQRDRVSYEQWIHDGLIEATEGDVIDYTVIRARIGELAERHVIRELVYDRFNATQLITQLGDDGLTVVPFGQGFVSMSAPTKEMEKILKEGKVRHGNHPVLTWMAGNVAVLQDPAGNLKPAKNKSSGRIDGIVAAIMGLGRAIVQPKAPEGPSVWVMG